MLFIANTTKDYKDKVFIKKLIDAGIDVLRFNFSYGSQEENIEKIKIAREVIKESGRDVKIMADLPGNKIRIGKLTFDPLPVKKDQILFFSGDNHSADIPVLLSGLEKFVSAGDTITYKDGELAFSIVEILPDGFKGSALNDYSITSNKGLNIGRAIDGLNHLTEKTIEQIGAVNIAKPDFVAFSFANSKESMMKNKSALFEKSDSDYKPIIVAKVESELGIQNIDEIIDESDWIMIARGDLALNIPFSKLGLHQKLITSRTKVKGKKVIVATQILDSLLSSHIPSRGDILDVTNIALDGNDGMMFSCTSSAENPEQIVLVAKDIISYL